MKTAHRRNRILLIYAALLLGVLAFGRMAKLAHDVKAKGPQAMQAAFHF